MSQKPSRMSTVVGLEDIDVQLVEKHDQIVLTSHGADWASTLYLTFVVDNADSARKVGEAFLALADRMLKEKQ